MTEKKIKTLKLTLIVLFLSFVKSTNAQDTTNDATWKETIKSLKEFLPNFNHKTEIFWTDGSYDWSLHEYSIKRKKISRVEKIDNDKIILIVEANLSKLESVKVYDVKSGSGIRLLFSEKIVKYNASGHILYKDSFTIEFVSEITAEGHRKFIEPNGSNTQSLIKNLKHLAYLNNEKSKNQNSKRLTNYSQSVSKY